MRRGTFQFCGVNTSARGMKDLKQSSSSLSVMATWSMGSLLRLTSYDLDEIGVNTSPSPAPCGSKASEDPESSHEKLKDEDIATRLSKSGKASNTRIDSESAPA
mmetsp:Transcript_21488/g.42215  ORF Transcript_21488/g.42215 Transcript_21488/m.42215 type:complete len:104 (+) Transcript_21488:1690-2001(+)